MAHQEIGGMAHALDMRENYQNERYLKMVNNAVRGNLQEISDQVMPNGFMLPLPEWIEFKNTNVRMLASGEIEITGNLEL